MLSARTNLSVYSHVRIFVFVLMILQYNPLAYNIDKHKLQIFSDPTAGWPRRSSYFGFSVALYTGAGGPLVLVGAPRANSTDITEPGTVFKCEINGVCKEWLIDKSKNDKEWLIDKIDKSKNGFLREKVYQVKDNAWIGANIAVENKTEARVVVCGPRWKIRNLEKKQFQCGICYGTLATNANAFETEAKQHWAPVLHGPRQIKTEDTTSRLNYAYAQVGFSLHMNSRNNNVDIELGSPAVNRKGDVILITAAMNTSTSRTIIPLVARDTRFDRHDYFGYSVTSGAYFKQGNIVYASGVTRSANMRGKVVVFEFPQKSIEFIKTVSTRVGEQIGEYFGTALTSCDVNNDGKDELIIGAPQWAKDMDEGRVYIFTTKHSTDLKLLTKIEGKIAGGRFGSTLMCLGDIDYDGYGDIAIGAPYEEESGGAVYIYNGNTEGVFKRYSQRLIGSDYSLKRDFGSSISEPRDINEDKYPDIAVGAYRPEKVVLLKSVPVVTLNVTLAYLKKIKLLRNETALFTIDVHVHYEGAYVPESLQIVKVLKIDQTHGSVEYLGESRKNGIYRISDTLYKNNHSCSSHEIHLTGKIQNILDPLEVSVSVELENDLSRRRQNSSTDTPCKHCVMINKFLSKTEDLVKLPFAMDCGEDEICTSDLNVTLSTDLSDNRYIIGSSSTIALHIDVHNQGEPAYQTKVHIFIETLSLANISSKCVENSRTNYILNVVCDLDDPLRTNETLTLYLDASKVTYDIKLAVIWANVSTHSIESTPSDNSCVTTVYFDVDMDITIVGKAQESLYSYSRGNKEKPLDNVRYQHLYEIQRFGVSPIEKVTLTLRFPTHWQHSTEVIAIASINNTINILDGSPFDCDGSIDASLSDSTIPSIIHVTDSSHVADNSTRTANFSSWENTLIDMPPANRTLYVNCTNSAVRCKQISCKVGPFSSTTSVAKLLITLDLQISNFTATLMKGKDIVFYVSEGYVSITQPYNVIQRHSHKPKAAFIITKFLGSPTVERIAMWILALSIVLGIVLLLLLILGLIKIGFFNRKKKMELEALKAETDKKYNVILETTSSTEVLDCN